MHRGALLATLIAPAILACNAPADLGELAAEDCVSPLRIATFNVRFDNPDDGVHAWPNRADRVIEHIESFGPDILGTQEALDHQVEFLAAPGNLDGYDREGVGRDDGERAGEYAALFFRRDRFARREGGTFWLSETPSRPKRPEEPFDWGTQLNRIATWAQLEDRDTGAQLLVVNTHFDHQSREARRKSAELIVEHLEEWSARVDALVVVGDLNARPETEPHRLLGGFEAESPVIDAFYLAPEDRRDVLTTLTRWRILLPGFHVDHVFVSPDVSVRDYRVHNRKYLYEGARRYTSDHLPVSAEICL